MVVCGVVLVWLCVVWCCSCCVFVCVTCFSLYLYMYIDRLIAGSYIVLSIYISIYLYLFISIYIYIYLYYMYVYIHRYICMCLCVYDLFVSGAAQRGQDQRFLSQRADHAPQSGRRIATRLRTSRRRRALHSQGLASRRHLDLAHPTPQHGHQFMVRYINSRYIAQQ